ncbi:F0F1 ATP synthase subunit delta [Candidatus Omnitrophota bacterium]
MLIWQLVSIQLITFALIVLFLRWLLHGLISRALRKLHQLNQENLEKEKTLKEELDRARLQAQREIKQAQAEGENIKQLARAKAEQEREEIINSGRQEARRLLNQGERESQRKQVESDLELEQRAVYLANRMIKYIFTEPGQQDLQTHLIDQLLTEIEALDQARVKPEGNQAEVTTAFKLKERQLLRLKQALVAKTNGKIGITEKVDPQIIAGLVIKLGGFVIDGSIKNKLKKIVPLIKEQAKEE